jgi:hypothetical protein
VQVSAYAACERYLGSVRRECLDHVIIFSERHMLRVLFAASSCAGMLSPVPKYISSGYSRRSMVENAIYRYKRLIGREMKARTMAGQRAEMRIGCKILNTMASLGMPNSYGAG